MEFIHPNDCKLWLESGKAELVDVREPWETAICTIGGTIIPMHDVCNRAKQFDANKDLIVVCKTGKRAEAVANFLKSEWKRENIFVMDGGITAWYATFEPSYEMY